MKVIVNQVLLVMLSTLIFTACQPDDGIIGGDDNDGLIQNGPNGDDDRLSALPTEVPFPADNPPSLAKEELGRSLFWDPITSGEKDVACATCHHPARGFADGIDLPIGVGGVGFAEDRLVGYTGFVGRNSPSVINTAFNGINRDGFVDPTQGEMFWDNRARSLETQATMPMHSFTEMRGNAYSEDATLDSIVARIAAIPAYRQMFADAFGNGRVDVENISKAIATYERSIVANNSPFDDYMRGDLNALDQRQIRGMQTFLQVGCANCHNGPMLSDFDLHVLGVRENQKLTAPDAGDGNFAFRTPTLRNLAFTAPYMHNGEFDNLQQVLVFYDRNNNNSQNPNVQDNELDQDLRRLDNLNGNDIGDIIAFLGALNDEDFDRTVPTSVPSGLNPGGEYWAVREEKFKCKLKCQVQERMTI